MLGRYLLILISLIVPAAAEAAVSISEVAWMGSSESANYEWIELHNDGESENIDGWVLTDGMNLSIELSGIISSGAYAVLERTSDTSSPGSAFLIYTGALVNTGATLQLKRNDSSLVDQVSGGEDWDLVGGDNVTKETAQYTKGGWITATATPGAKNSEEITDDVVESGTSTPDTPKHKSSNSGDTVLLTLPGVTLELDIEAQKAGYVNQPINFSVESSGVGKTLIDSLEYRWNFGDSFTAELKEPTHIFKYPGTYVVTAYAGFKRQEQVTRHEITILPVDISLTTNSTGDVQVNNDSPYEIDISNYKLKAEGFIIFPDYSILLPNQTITISKEKLGDTGRLLVGIYDSEGVLIDSIIPVSLYVESKQEVFYEYEPEPKVSSVSVSRQSVVPETQFGFADKSGDVDSDTVKDIKTDFSEIEANHVAQIVTSNTEKNKLWPYLIMVLVLLLSTIGVYAVPKRNEIE
jgi:hypothetical protein